MLLEELSLLFVTAGLDSVFDSLLLSDLLSDLASDFDSVLLSDFPSEDPDAPAPHPQASTHFPSYNP